MSDIAIDDCDGWKLRPISRRDGPPRAGQYARKAIDHASADLFIRAIHSCLRLAQEASAEAASMPREGPELTAHLVRLAYLDDNMLKEVEAITGIRFHVPRRVR